MLSFFMMIYDSIRQSKPAIRNSFGVGRFNTRLNFYFFEIYRLKFTQQKNFIHNRALSQQTTGFGIPTLLDNQIRLNNHQKSRSDITLLSLRSLDTNDVLHIHRLSLQYLL